METSSHTLQESHDRRRFILSWQIAQAAFVLAYYLLKLYGSYNTPLVSNIMYNFAFPVIIGFATLTLTQSRFLRGWDGIALLAFCVWFLIVEIIGSGAGFTTYNEITYHLIHVMLVCYPVAFLLPPEKRRKVLHGMLHGILAAMTLLCLLAIVVVLMQVEIPAIGRYTLGMSPSLHRLYLFMYPNTAGTLCTITLMLSVHMLLAARRWPARIWYGIAILAIATVLALTDSRANLIASAAGIGCLSFLLLYRGLRAKRWVRWVAGIAGMAAIFAIALFAFRLPVLLVEQGTRMLHPAEQSQAVSPPEDAAGEAAAQETPDVAMTQPREILTELGDFNQRNEVWAATFRAIADNPRLLLLGSGSNNVMRAVLPYSTGIDYPHLHNSFLQILVSMGLPGLLLFLAFLAMVVWRSVKLFLGLDAQAPLADRFLPVTLLCCLIVMLVESQFVMTYQYLFDPLFFLVAGYIMWPGTAPATLPLDEAA